MSASYFADAAPVGPKLCPLCAKNELTRKNMVRLYGHEICKSCRNGYLNRRQFAYIVDMLLYYAFALVFGIVFGIVAMALIESGQLSKETFESLTSVIGYVIMPVFLFRDAFYGYSPGKALMGLQTINDNSGQPCSVAASILRTLLILIPIVPLIIAFQISNGYRWGDGWAATKVIWLKYANSPVFLPRNAAIPQILPASEVNIQPQLVSRPDDGNPYRPPQR